MKLLIKSLILISILSIQLSAQGQIFKAAEAENIYGKVSTQVEVATVVINDLLSKTDRVVMFRVVNNFVNIKGDNRIDLLKNFNDKSDNDVYFAYSIEKVKELIRLGGNQSTFVQTRGNILTVQNGSYVLEIAVPCPPCCPDCD